METISESNGHLVSTAVTRSMVHARARELASGAGRDALHVTHSDYIRARRELTGESEFARQDAVINSFSKAKASLPAKRHPSHMGKRPHGKGRIHRATVPM